MPTNTSTMLRWFFVFWTTTTLAAGNYRNDYGTLQLNGEKWRPFWWYEAKSGWPKDATDVLGGVYGSCNPDSTYCFGRLPEKLLENSTQLLARDSRGNAFRWSFNPANALAHAAWQAFHDQKLVTVQDAAVWPHQTLSGPGRSSRARIDSFAYHMSNGVKSLILDDDLCGCNTLLFVGSSMCLIHTDRYKVRHDLAGVGSLTTTGCDADEPSPANGLVLFFNDNARTTEDLTTTVAPTTARTTVRTTTTTTKRSRKATPRPEHSYNERHDTGIIKASEEPTDDSDVVVRIEGDSVVATVRGDRRSSLLAPRLANPLSATEEDNPAGAAATEDNRATDKERTAKKRMEEEAEAAEEEKKRMEEEAAAAEEEKKRMEEEAAAAEEEKKRMEEEAAAAEEEKKRVAEEIRAAAAEKKRIEEEAKAAAAEEKKKAEENEAKAAAAERKARRRAIRDEQVRRKLGLYRPGDPRLRGFGPGGPLRASGYGELSQNPDFGAHPQQARISDSNLQSSTEYGGYPAQAYEGQAGYAGGQRRIRYPLTRSRDVAAGRGFGAGLTPIGAPERYLPPRDAGYSNQYRSPPPRFAPPVQYGLVKVTADDDGEEPGIEELRDRDLRYEGFLRDERGGHYRQQPSYGAAPSYAGASAYGAPPTGFYGPPPTHRGFERVRSK